MKLINWKDDFLKRVVIIGAGASGMLAAKVASDRGYKVIVLEKQKRCGQKLLITGKGRCNITNNCEIEELIEQKLGHVTIMIHAEPENCNKQHLNC